MRELQTASVNMQRWTVFWIAAILSTATAAAGSDEVKCHPGGPEKQMMDLGVVCAELSGGVTDQCDGTCRASWDANFSKCLEPFWQFIPAPFRPPFDRVKEVCLAAPSRTYLPTLLEVSLRVPFGLLLIHKIAPAHLRCWLYQDCPDDPNTVSSSIEAGLAVCSTPDGCAGTTECEQFVAFYKRCLKPFQPFVIGGGFANSTITSVIAACLRPRLKQASGRS